MTESGQFTNRNKRKKKLEADWADEFARILKENRISRQISQWDLSLQLKIRETMYQSFESGRVLPSLPKAHMLMNYFNLDPTETFDLIDRNVKEKNLEDN